MENFQFWLSCSTGELGYDGPLYDGFSHMTDDMLGPSPICISSTVGHEIHACPMYSVSLY